MKREDDYGVLKSKVLDDLLNYEDYRSFLVDFFDEQKEIQKTFTHRFFCEKAGFSNPSYAHYVMQGKYNLTPRNMPGMVKALGLIGEEIHYFQLLVEYNQTEKPERKKELEAEIHEIRERNKLYQLDKTHFRFFDEWYFPVLKILVVHSDWNGDFAKLGSLCYPGISEDQARRGVALLEDIGLVRKDANGKWYTEQPNMATDQVPPAVMKKHRRDLLMRNVEAADNLEATDRFINYSTIGTSRAVYQQITQKLRTTQKQIMDMVLKDDGKVEQVFQVNCNVVPLSERFADDSKQETRQEKKGPGGKGESS